MGLEDNNVWGIVLTLSVILGNVVLFIWFVVQLVLEKLYERKQEKLRKELEQETTGVRKVSLGNRLNSLTHMFGRNAKQSAISNVSEIELRTYQQPNNPALNVEDGKTNAFMAAASPPHPERLLGSKKRTKNSPAQAEKLRKKRTRSMEARRARKGNVSLKAAYKNPLKKRGRKKVQVDNDDIEILTDGNGRKYSFNNTTDEAKWLDEESVDETQTEETEWLGVYPEENETTDIVFNNENINDVDVAKLEILEDDDGRRYSWNPTTDETSWIDAENEDEITRIEMTMKQ